MVLGLYLLLKFGQLALAGDFKYLFSSGLLSILFWTEILVGSLIPLVRLLISEAVPSECDGALLTRCCHLAGWA